MSGIVFQFEWEVELIKWIQANIMNIPFVCNLCIFFTYFGEPFMAALIISFSYLAIDKRIGKNIALSTLASSVINPMIKNLFFRIRPYMANEMIECLKQVDMSGDIYDIQSQGYSFPSGHSSNISALATSLNLNYKNKILKIVSIIIVLLTGFSRFALGVHYPSDVIVGILLGFIVVLLYNFLGKKIGENKLAIISLMIFSLGFLYCDSNDFYSCYGIYFGFVFATIFEEKYVNFENTKNILRAIVRTLIGISIFLAISNIIKIPFDESFLESATVLAYSIRAFRYALASFIALGVYPMVFKYNIFKFKD